MTTLGEALDLVIDHRGLTPKKLGTDFMDTGVPVISASMVREGRVFLDESRFVDEITSRRWMPEFTRPHDVILTSEAPLGRVALVQDARPLVLGQRVFGLRGRSGVLDGRYLYYWLQTSEAQSELQGRATGTTVVGIRQSALLRVPFDPPAFVSQRRIAEVLSALDDQVASNRRIMAITGELCEAEFGCAVRSSGPIYTYGEVAEVSGGGTPSTSQPDYWDGAFNWATPTDITSLGAPYLDCTSRQITDAGLANCSSALYPEGSILMTSRATIGAFALAKAPTATNQGFIVVQALNPDHQLWLFHEMRSRVNDYIAHANGATFLELSRGKFKDLPVAWPLEEGTFAAFNARVKPLHDRAYAAMKESRTLAALRDTLLPALMSGRLSVRDAEAAVSEVV